MDLLDERPDLQAELATLLAQTSGGQSITQVADATNGGKVAQVAGDSNTVKIR